MRASASLYRLRSVVLVCATRSSYVCVGNRYLPEGRDMCAAGCEERATSYAITNIHAARPHLSAEKRWTLASRPLAWYPSCFPALLLPACPTESLPRPPSYPPWAKLRRLAPPRLLGSRAYADPSSTRRQRCVSSRPVQASKRIGVRLSVSGREETMSSAKSLSPAWRPSSNPGSF